MQFYSNYLKFDRRKAIFNHKLMHNKDLSIYFVNSEAGFTFIFSYFTNLLFTQIHCAGPLKARQPFLLQDPFF